MATKFVLDQNKVSKPMKDVPRMLHISLTFSCKHFMHTQDENKFNDYQIMKSGGLGSTQQDSGFWLPLENVGMGRDEIFLIL